MKGEYKFIEYNIFRDKQPTTRRKAPIAFVRWRVPKEKHSWILKSIL